MKPTTDKFKTNKHAKQMKAENEARQSNPAFNMTPQQAKAHLKKVTKELDRQDNLARKLGTEESVEMIKDSLWRWNGYELINEDEYKTEQLVKKALIVGLIIGFALGILFSNL